MREILFRGKRVSDGEWVYGNYIWELFNLGTKYISLSNGEDVFHVHPDTIEQFTGITDKNGQKIFEGDIVCAMLDWGPAGMIESLVRIEFDKYRGYQWDYFDLDTIEVVGNIHDNPEFLDDGKDFVWVHKEEVNKIERNIV